MGLFEDLFDFNRDAKLDALEETAEFSFFMNMIESCEQDEEDDDLDF